MPDLQRKSFLRGFTYAKQGALPADRYFEMTVEQDYNFDLSQVVRGQ